MNKLIPDPVTVVYRTKDELYSAYMGFVKEGALFIHSKKKFELGQKINVILELMEEAAPIEFCGEIIWVTPIGAQSGMHPGFGVRFEGDVGQALNKKITTYLAGLERSDKSTDTL